MQFVVILNYSTGTIYYKQIPEGTEINNEWFRQYGMREKDCSWMLTHDIPSFTKIDW